MVKLNVPCDVDLAMMVLKYEFVHVVTEKQFPEGPFYYSVKSQDSLLNKTF